MADNSINQLIPIKDESSLAFNELFDRLGTLDLTSLLVYLVDEVEASALPHLAEQFHVMGNEGWLQVNTDTEKRNLIKQAVDIHKYKGTKYALLKILEMLNLQGRVREWFEYGGQPYCFKVEAGFADRGADENLISKIEDLINEYKNERSHLDNLEIFLITVCNAPKYGLCLFTGDEITVYPKPKLLHFDDENWNEKNWSENPVINTRVEPIIWNSENFDDKGWAFG
ncbi:MAG: phage tail protein I [bacterium]